MRTSLLIALGLSGSAHAACGIDACPRLPTDAATTVQLSTSVRALGLSLGGLHGSAIESVVQAAWSMQRLTLAITAPFITLNADGATAMGLGNVVVSGETPARWDQVATAVGLQVETPTGADTVADDHFELLPYARAQFTGDTLRAQAWLGYRHAVSADHAQGAGADDGHAHSHAARASVASVYLDAHGAQELIYRGLIGFTAWRGRLQPAVGVDGQQVLVAGKETLLTGQASLRSRWTETLALTVRAEVPVTEARRFDWSTTLRLDVSL